MDVKQRIAILITQTLRSLYAMEAMERIKVCSAVVLLGLLSGCENPIKKKPLVINNDNSQFAGKECYGESRSNQYIVSWNNGKVSTFSGHLEDLYREPALEEGAEILYVEQDRVFPQWIERGYSNIKPEQMDSGRDQTFWQVWGQTDAEVDILWNEKIEGQGITVAVIDAGVDQTHPSLELRIAVNENEVPNNGIDDDFNGLVDDYTGYDFAHRQPIAPASPHGTHVAGIIAADPKASPMVGVAPRANILPLNIMSSREGGSLSAAVLAIHYAVKRGARIINASWGGSICADSLKVAIMAAGDQGVLFISAAGNEAMDVDIYPEFPTGFNLENQLSVSASVPSGLLAAFSNYGRNTVHLMAPGHQILSSVPGGWQIASGTSMAAPFVSGIAALLWSAHPEASVQQIRRALLRSVRTPREFHPVKARGRVNAPQSLKALREVL